MVKLIAVHHGNVVMNRETIFNTVRGKRHDCLFDLNGCLFDILRVNALPLMQLPPLDDWTRSTEDPSLWSWRHPEMNIIVTLKTSLIEI